MLASKRKMKNSKFSASTVLGVIIFVLILVLAARYIIRVIYWQEIWQWEDEMWRSVGLNPEVMRMIVGVIGIAFLFFLGWSKSKKKL